MLPMLPRRAYITAVPEILGVIITKAVELKSIYEAQEQLAQIAKIALHPIIYTLSNKDSHIVIHSRILPGRLSDHPYPRAPSSVMTPLQAALP